MTVYRRRLQFRGAAGRWRLSKHFSPQPMWGMRWTVVLLFAAAMILWTWIRRGG